LEKGFATPFRHFEQARFVLRAEAQDIANHNNTGTLNINLLNLGTPSFQNVVNARVGNTQGTADGRVLRLWGKFTF
jgi:hypothetical protein